MGGAVDARRQRRRTRRPARRRGRTPRRGGRSLVRRRDRAASRRRRARIWSRSLVLLDPAVGLDGAVDARHRRRHDGLAGLPRPRRGAHREGDGLVGRRGPGRTGRRTRRASDRAAERPLRLADQHPRDDVVLERAGSRYRAAAQGNSGRRWSAPRRTDPPYVTDALIDGTREQAGTAVLTLSTSTAITWWPRPSPPRPRR